jgi:hypothetical protein
MENSYCVVYVIETRAERERYFYPWVHKVFAEKREALTLCRDLIDKFSYTGREFRVRDYLYKRP